MRSLIILLAFFPLLVSAQQKQLHPGEIKLKLKKLNFLGSVLYVAAHPDDENTRIITAMANERLAASAYLSMTRGDGGQNLIGPELKEELGLIRTQELLTARAIDGGEQFFTRAIDFGYSKSADETLQLWGRDTILHDVVKVFRQYQPDVVITRFPPDERAGHGHHTASALLALEAFDVAAQPDRFSGLAKEFGTWQPKRLYTNTGRWWNNTINENTPGIIVVDVGNYSALLGESMSEIAARSRSQHKSQGFGSKGTRGRQLEFLEYQKGERAQKDIFEGVNTRWTRLKGGEKIEGLVNNIINAFNSENPAASVPALFELRKNIAALEKSVWRDRKLRETEELIQACLGLFAEVTADQYWVAPGENVQMNFELVNRSESEIIIESISVPGVAFDSALNSPLKKETPILFKSIKKVNPNTPFSDAYWLKKEHGIGLFNVTDKKLIGKGFNDPTLPIIIKLRAGKELLTINTALVYKWTDPVKGELGRPFEIVPPLFVNIDERVLIFKDVEPKMFKVRMKSSSRIALDGYVKLDMPKGWRSEPDSMRITLAKFGDEQLNSFKVYPSASEMNGELRVMARVTGDGGAIFPGREFYHGVKVLAYDHIPTQTLLPAADAKVIRVDLKESRGLIAYVKGAGDEVPAALRNMGYDVWELKEEEVSAENLKRADAVVLGIRAVNTNQRIGFIMDDILEYVHNGGTVVVQYNTSFDLETEAFAPYPLSISRDRVTDENSEVRILKPEHRMLNYPNKITTEDFKGWIQERGLYFPNKWDSKYEALLSMNDKNEPAKDGALLVAQHGSGYYVYTGLSFFRQLPEGVSGAYKLFANLVSMSKAVKETEAGVQKKKKKGKV
jgi:LmbE family N-acetylglucosaminyl deacetylase